MNTHILCLFIDDFQKNHFRDVNSIPLLPPRITNNVPTPRRRSNENPPKILHNSKSQLTPLPPECNRVSGNTSELECILNKRRFESKKPKVSPPASIRNTTPQKNYISQSSDEHDDYPQVVSSRHNSNIDDNSDPEQERYVKPIGPTEQVSRNYFVDS